MDDFFNNISPENEVQDIPETTPTPEVEKDTIQPEAVDKNQTPQEQPTQETIVQPPVNEPTFQQPPVNQGFAPAYNSTPYGAPYAIPTQGQPVYRQPQQPKKKKNTGKIVFVSLICLCIIISSIAVGFGLSEKEAENNKVQNSQNKDEFGADAVIEDSPVSYSEYSGKGPMTSEQVYRAVKGINVGILVYSRNQKVGEGSGIIVGESKDKKSTYILTAAHVIAAAGETVQVQFNDESEVEATIVGFDEKTDIGVLRINKTGYAKATFGNSSKLNVGQKVYAIGNPGGTEFFGSFTSGIISAIDRPVPTTNSSYDLPCIQHNAAINPGNSGGALVNEYGQVIGLNSSKISSTEYEGMGFAVPSETMLEVYNEIIKNGYVSNRPMLGITYFPVSSDYNYSAIAWRNGLPYGSIVIASIAESSDMAKHGIKEGDIITAVNGKELETTDILLEAIEKGKVGDKIKLSVCRMGPNGTVSKTFDATVKLVEDKGDNKVPETPVETTNPFGGYFDDFGY